jgi:hypothetical protein
MEALAEILHKSTVSEQSPVSIVITTSTQSSTFLFFFPQRYLLYASLISI